MHAITSYDTNKIVTVCRMLSGRFRCGSLVKHFSKNGTDLCELCCDEPEDLVHVLVPHCVHIYDRTYQLLTLAADSLSSCPPTRRFLFETMHSEDDYLKVQMLLDLTVLPLVIRANQSDKTVIPLMLYVTSTWCYSINRRRMKL